MAAKNPQTVAEAWAKNLAANASKIKDGVNGVTESPMEKAVANQQGLINGFMDAINSGKWAAKTRAVSLSDWKAATIAGANRLQAGAEKGKPKMMKFLTKFLPFVETVRQQVRSMPNSTKEERRARMLANFDLMSQFTG